MLTAAEVSALVLSIKAASLSLLLILPPGLLVGWILAKLSFPGKSLLNTIVMLPMVLPPVVSGFFLLILLSKRGLIGGLLFRLFGLEIVFSWLAVVLAISVLSFPLLVRGIVTAMEAVNPQLENAARTLGASPLKVFFTVTLPLSYRGIIGGAILGFSRSLGEFGATVMVAGNIPGKTQTLPLAIYNFVQTRSRCECIPSGVFIHLDRFRYAMDSGTAVYQEMRYPHPPTILGIASHVKTQFSQATWQFSA